VTKISDRKIWSLLVTEKIRSLSITELVTKNFSHWFSHRFDDWFGHWFRLLIQSQI